MSDNCACNYGDDSTDDAKLNCWAKLVPNDPTDPSKGYKKCEDMPPGSGEQFSKNCDDNVGPDGMVCYTKGGETDKDGNYVKNTGKCVSRPKIPKYLGLGKIKCIGKDPAGNCNLRGTSGPDCRACKKDGNDDAPNGNAAFPGTKEGRCKAPSKPSGGGGGSSAAEAAAAIAAAKRGLLPFEMVAATAGIELFAPLVCGPLESAIAAGDGAGNPVVQAMSNLLQCDKRSAAAAASPSPSPSPTQSS